MIGRLPSTVEIDGIEYSIRTDFRDILTICQAFNDEDLSSEERWQVALKIFYINEVPSDIQKAAKGIVWFINCGNEEVSEQNANDTPVYDWEQDEQLIFSAVNKVAGHETRADQYMHWWTFMGLFQEVGESTFATVINIRNKKRKHKRLEKHEQDFYKENKQLIDIKRHISKEEKEIKERMNQFLK